MASEGNAVDAKAQHATLMGSQTPQTSEDALDLTNASFDHRLDLLRVSLLCKGYTDHLVSVAGSVSYTHLRAHETEADL
eukprot:3032089-Rhodomonas_salina.1